MSEDSQLKTEDCSKSVKKALRKPIKKKDNEELKEDMSDLQENTNDEYHTLFLNFSFFVVVCIISLLVWWFFADHTVKSFGYLLLFLFGFSMFLSITEKRSFDENIYLSKKEEKAYSINLKHFDNFKGQVRWKINNNKILQIIALPLIRGKSPIVTASLANPLKDMHVEEMKRRGIKPPEDHEVNFIDPVETCEGFQTLDRWGKNLKDDM